MDLGLVVGALEQSTQAITDARARKPNFHLLPPCKARLPEKHLHHN